MTQTDDVTVTNEAEDVVTSNEVVEPPISDLEWHRRRSEVTARKPTQAGIADRNVPGSNHACIGHCTIQTCDVWRNYAISIGRVTEVAPGEYQSEVDVAYDAMDMFVLRKVAEILSKGRKVYGHDAWRARTPSHHLNHAIAHIVDHLDGRDMEEDHLGNAICRLMFAYGVFKVVQDNNVPDPEKRGRNAFGR